MKLTSFVIKLLANEEIVDQMKLRAALIGEVGTRRFLPLTPVSRPESHHCQYKRGEFPSPPSRRCVKSELGKRVFARQISVLSQFQWLCHP